MKPTIFISGATSGFGLACAELFAEKGWQLIICGRRRERLDQLCAQLETPIHSIVLDVREREAVKQSVQDIPEQFADIDVLLNNAGLALGLEPAHEASLDDWDTMVDTNIKGLTYLTRAILPGMVERKKGHVINIGSIAGNWPYPGGNTYGASKAFVKQFSNNLRCDVHGSGVRVSNIEPGIAETEFSVVRFHGDKSRADSVYEHTKPLTAPDIADIVYWVASVPPHVNINALEVMPVCQSWAPFAIHREEK